MPSKPKCKIELRWVQVYDGNKWSAWDQFFVSPNGF